MSRKYGERRTPVGVGHQAIKKLNEGTPMNEGANRPTHIPGAINLECMPSAERTHVVTTWIDAKQQKHQFAIAVVDMPAVIGMLLTGANRITEGWSSADIAALKTPPQSLAAPVTAIALGAGSDQTSEKLIIQIGQMRLEFLVPAVDLMRLGEALRRPEGPAGRN